MTQATHERAEELHAKILGLTKQFTKRMMQTFKRKQSPDQALVDLGCEIFALLSLSTELVDILTDGEAADWNQFLEELEEHPALQSVQREAHLKFPPHRPRRVLWIRSRMLYNRFHTFVANA